MIDSALDKYPDEEYVINDLSSACFNSFLGIGQILGPLYGSLMTENTNFRVTCDVLGILFLAYSFLYMIMTDGYSAFKDSKCEDK